MKDILVSNLSFPNLTLLNKTLASVIAQQVEINVDLRNLSFSKPEGFLHLALILREFKRKKTAKAKMTISNKSNVTSYLAHIGFFDLIEFPYGQAIGVARGSNSYVPIRKIDKNLLSQTSFETGESLQDLIQLEAESLARVLLNTTQRTANFLIISYSIREAIRNALEHSEMDVCYVCGQKWANGQSQITVIDEGIGIYESFRKAELENVSANDFLDKAIKPGFSRTTNLPDVENIHDNSGYGLFVLHEIARNYGNFLLSSSDSFLSIDRITGRREGHSQHQGTLISLTFNSYPNDAKDLLEMIIESGEEEAVLEGRKKSSRRSKSLVTN